MFVAIVTGGASGVGRGMAEAFADAGARLLLADVNEARLKEVAEALGAVTQRTDVRDPDQVEALADQSHGFNDIAAAISSGSFKTIGMVVVPCTVKTLSGIANCFSQNLLLRAADVVLKDQRKLILVLRETPLHLGHVRLMAQAIEPCDERAFSTA